MNDDKRYYQQSYRKMIIMLSYTNQIRISSWIDLIKEESISELLRFTIKAYTKSLSQNYPPVDNNTVG